MEKNKRKLRDNFAYLMKYAWKEDKNLFLYFLLCSLCTATIPFIGIYTPKFLVTELEGGARVEVLVKILIGILIVSIVSNFGSIFLEGIIQPRIISVRFKLIRAIQRKCLTMNFKRTEDPETLNQMEACMQAVMNSSDGVEGVYKKTYQLIGAAIAFLGYVAIVFTLNVWVLLYLLANVSIVYFFTMRARKYEYSRKEERAQHFRKKDYVYNTMQDFKYGKDIRIFNLSNWMRKKFRENSQKLVDIEAQVQREKLKVKMTSVFLLLIREGIVYAYLIYCVIYRPESMGIGDFMMYFVTISGFAMWMEKVLDNIAFINTQNMYITDMRTFLDTDEGEMEESIEIPDMDTYSFQFENVSFKYPNTDRYIFRNLSLKIEKGQRLAIVGINGAGKTTLIKLLTRLYEPTEGRILLNGMDIAKFNKHEYFKLFSAVFQEINMFAFTVGENVAVRKDGEFDRARAELAIEKADMDEKINSLEKGMDTTLLKGLDPKGVELSGGQNQRLALARALYKNGKVIVLDEPTAALDPIAEYETYKRFNSMVGDKTAVYISHRLASTRFCDVIAFFEDGEIKEYGTHEELLANNGRYNEIFNVQASYYKENVGEECV